MKNLWNSFKISFSMYSKIPMPYADWKKENMQYAMCFFPLIGAVIGALVLGWAYLLPMLPFKHGLACAVFLLIPILITGGIHFDGFLDTQDAKSSYQPIDKRLEILKDPHTGAFAIISAVVYYIMAYGIWSEVTLRSAKILAVGFVVSRSLSGLSVVTFPMAKTSGLAATFSNNARKQKVKITMIGYLLITTGLMLWVHVWLGAAAMVTAVCVFFYYKRMCMKQFGGLTGDLAGYFLQVCELAMAIVVISLDLLGGMLGWF